ncbi:hypothetical protein GH714_022479 [Hevea brasiliensis]|uniref:Transposase-associated domain-containing protein n=1 Tax=Hevea brasiliensis TaxID=3981 RepID=A0A6A6M8V3_HEVBR|nr:hypothetical protein GH714_022479 [Hevea brasiliensis]
MDRSWMNKPRNSYEYKKVTEFLHFAFHNASQCGKILCPCIHCVNRSWQSYDDARVHLICDGFLRGYTKWICHGENPTTNMDQSSSSQHTTNVHTTEHVEECNTTTLNTRRSDDIVGLLRDALGVSSQGNYRVRQDVEELHYEKDRVENESQLDEINIEQLEDTSSRRTSEFENLLKDVNVELYPGCKTFSRLSFILQLYHLKCLNGWTGKSFTMLLELLVDAFPEGDGYMRGMNFDFKKISLMARLDLVDMGIRSELHPQISESGKSKLPPASFTMTKKEREILCEVVKNVKMPDGYASNISRCVNIKERKISGLKTHDSHILFEYILPLALRVCGPSQQVTSIVIELDVILDDKSLMQAHRYVLRHYDEIEHFRQNIVHCREFVAIERRKCRRHVHLDSNAFNKLINEKFHDWFRNKVMTMDGTSVSNDIVSLGIGPNKVAKRFSGFIINGIRFHTSAREEQRLTQNSGVVNISEVGGVNYYGRIQDVIELNYYGAFKVVMFKCDWFDVHHNMGVKQDEYGFTLLNFSRLIHTGEKVDDDPYVFSSQVEQVFYVQDPKNTNWHAVVKVKSRDSFDVVNDEAKYYDPLKTKEQISEDVPKDVLPPQWTALVNEWFTEKNQKMSSINTANAKKQKNAHTTGRKSYARLMKEMEKARALIASEVKDLGLI